MGNWATNAIDFDLSHLEDAATVRLVATMSLVTCGDKETVSAALARDVSGTLDYLPVRDDRSVIGVLCRKNTMDPDRLVRDVMSTLHSGMLVSAADPLLPVLETLDDDLGFRLVLQDREIRGIVTLSDLQKLPVRPLVFARITHVELLLAELIRQRTQNDDERWLPELSEGRREKLLQKWNALRKANAELTRLECMDFADKRDAVLRLGGLSGWSKNKAKECLEDIEQLRNKVAHAADYAASPEEARRTVFLLRELRRVLDSLRSSLGRDEMRGPTAPES
jgi:hypothetical protein